MKRLAFSFAAILVVAAGCGEVRGIGADAFEPLPDPTIAAVQPDFGPLAGGTQVSISGTGFAPDGSTPTRVLVGGLLASDVSVGDDGALTFVTPPGIAPGPVDVTVFNDTGYHVANGAFSYNPPPLLFGVTPRGGAPGATITVTGEGFQDLGAGTPTVTIGGAAAASVSVVSDSELTFQLPASWAGPGFVPQDVVLSNANGSAIVPRAVGISRPGLLVAQNQRAQNQRGLHFVDPATGETTYIGRIQAGIGGMATAADGTIFVTTAGGTPYLGTLDPFTGSLTPIGVLRESGNNNQRRFSDLTFIGNNLYGYQQHLRRLVQINTTTAVFTVLGANSQAHERSSCITPNGVGAVYLLRELSTSLFSLNTVDSTTVDLGALSGGWPSVFCKGAQAYEGSIYIVTHGSAEFPWANGINRLVRVNPNTRAIVEVGELPEFTDAITRTP